MIYVTLSLFSFFTFGAFEGECGGKRKRKPTDGTGMSKTPNRMKLSQQYHYNY